MGAALTPELALDYLSELSADVRAGVVLDPTGARLAGMASLAAPAALALAALGGAREGQALLADGAVFASRGTGLALVLVCGPRALPELARHDLRLVLSDLEAGDGAGEAPPEPPQVVPSDLARALLSAAQRGAESTDGRSESRNLRD